VRFLNIRFNIDSGVTAMNQVANQHQPRNIVSLPGAGRSEVVLGINHLYRLEEQQTGGALACIEALVPPDHGVPPHTHYLEDEIFYVVEGCVQVSGDDLSEPMTIPQGTLLQGHAVVAGGLVTSHFGRFFQPLEPPCLAV
jgi:quercetin dioxygenase-like cupin family protein